MSSPTTPLHLVWRRLSLDGALETTFIRDVLLGGVRRPVRPVVLEEHHPTPYFDHMLIVSLGEEADQYVLEAARRGCRDLGVLHMGDEHGEQGTAFYDSADYVLRNYYFRHVFEKPRGARTRGMIWVPNGYRVGVGPLDPARGLPAALRPMWGFFAGVLADRTFMHERSSMVRVVTEHSLPFVVLETPSFGQGLGPVTYAMQLGNALFAPAPGGNAPETIRLYDALEAGAIPIALNHPYLHAPEALGALGKPPFPILESWDELPTYWESIARERADPEAVELERLRQRCLSWWQRIKRHTQDQVAALIGNGEVAEASG